MISPRLGLIAGGGGLPQAVAQRCEAEGRPIYIVRLEGFADPHLARWPGGDFGMAQIGALKLQAQMKLAGGGS